MMKFRAVVLEGDKPNKNHRVYPRVLLERIVQDFQDDVKSRRLLGQMDYPEDSIIHFDRASHVITELVMEGDNMVAEIETLDTPFGRVLESLLSGGAALALRPYGVGNGKVNDDGILMIDDSYKMVSISVVEADKAS